MLQAEVVKVASKSTLINVLLLTQKNTQGKAESNDGYFYLGKSEEVIAN